MRDFEKLTMRINGGEEITLVDGEKFENFEILREAAGSDYENLNDDLMNGRHANGNDFTVIVWNEDGSTTEIAFHYEPAIWYAVQETKEDDWGTGSSDLEEALAMLREQGRGLIAVIEEGPDPVCIEEIPFDAVRPVYAVRDREAGNVIETFDTREEAEKALKEYEASDETEGIYTPGFYEIAEVEA